MEVDPAKFIEFCGKDPRNALRIFSFLTEILPLIEDATTESKILDTSFGPKGPIISETASRPLVSEKDKKVRKKVIKQIVKKAEQKVIEGCKPTVTGQEVEEILDEVKSEIVEKKGVVCNVLYVDAINGDDTAGNGTEDNPFKTGEIAANSTDNEDTILIMKTAEGQIIRHSIKYVRKLINGMEALSFFVSLLSPWQTVL